MPSTDWASLTAGSHQVADWQPSYVDGIAAKIVFTQMLERATGLIDEAIQNPQIWGNYRKSPRRVNAAQ